MKIEIEGTDGAGKSTAVKYLAERLRDQGLTVLETREVGSKLIPTCLKLREIVLSPESDMSGEAMELVFAAMRLENERFYQRQKSADVILSDRGWLSHLAYTDHNVSKEFTDKFYLDFLQPLAPMPDLVIYLDLSTETAQKRISGRGEALDAIELKGLEFQENVRQSFAEHIEGLEKYSPETNVVIIDANKDLESVQGQLELIVANLSQLTRQDKQPVL